MATCRSPADNGWAELHPAIQREIRDALSVAGWLKNFR